MEVSTWSGVILEIGSQGERISRSRGGGYGDRGGRAKE